MKNLVLFHLESLSDVILKLNEDCFPNIKKWREHAEVYKNYYSTATSTWMVMTDMFFGNMGYFEQADYLENIFEIDCPAESIFSFLHKKGYYTKNFYYGCANEEESVKKLHQMIVPEGDCWVGDQEEDFQKELDRCLEQNSPFAIFIADDASHIGYQGPRLVQTEKCLTEWHRDRFQRIDTTLGYLFDLLVDKNLMENTVVCMYGDHGEEYWFHGLYEGYTHAIEPFVDIIHCPLFIFDGFHNYKENTDLTASVDIVQIMKEKLGFASPKSEPRKYVIARNLYAAQKYRADVFHKSYCVTNGIYSLIVTQKGISFYNNRLDPFCFTNLLNFFKIKKGHLFYINRYDRMLSTHYKNFMTVDKKQEIIQEFNDLHAQLTAFLHKQTDLKEQYPLNRIAYNKTNRKVIWIKYNKGKALCRELLKRLK